MLELRSWLCLGLALYLGLEYGSFCQHSGGELTDIFPKFILETSFVSVSVFSCNICVLFKPKPSLFQKTYSNPNAKYFSKNYLHGVFKI